MFFGVTPLQAIPEGLDSTLVVREPTQIGCTGENKWIIRKRH